MEKINQDEINYLNMTRSILKTGEDRQDRTGTGTKSIFGSRLKFSLLNNTFPLLTTKKMFLKGVVEELLFFIRGETDTKKLEAKGVNIWKGNTTRKFLDSRGLKDLKEGDMGKGYGYQWRRYGETDEVECWDCCHFNTVKGVDQLKEVVKSLKDDPFSRRHIINAWNPQQLKEMALPPCHCFIQFYVNSKNELSCQWYQRSVDTFLGLPFNIASYALFTHIMAKATGLTAKEVIFVGGDTHIYTPHIEQVQEQLQREPFAFPKINIKKEINSIEDMEQLQYEDFELIDYQCHPAIKAMMAV